MTTILLAIAVIQHANSIQPQEALKQIEWLKGDWVGKQDFNTGGAPMVGEATIVVQEVVGGRYLEERLSTVLPGRKPTDTRHMLAFDAATQTFRAWWFNDTSVAPTEFEGKLDGGKLVLLSKPKGSGPQNAVLRATYAHKSQDNSPQASSGDGREVAKRIEQAAERLTFTLEMQTGAEWQLLFTSTYFRREAK